jgi:HlyD family secretion protein
MFSAIRKHPFIAVFSIGVFVLLGLGFMPQPVLVETVDVIKAPLSVTIEEEGRTRVIDRYVISAPVSGVACRQQLKVGDNVQHGQILLSITPLEAQVLDARSRAQAEAQQQAAEATFNAAQEQARAAAAAAHLAQIELQRLQPLMQQSMISRDNFDRARTAVQTTTAAKRSADFNVETARYELEAASSLLDYSAASSLGEPVERVAVRSPIEGRILKINRQCEGPVTTGEPLLEVGDPRALEVEVDVLSADAVKIKPGMHVLFERWGGEAPLEGMVRIVEPVGFTKTSALGVDEQRVLIISDFTSPTEQWSRLGDGYRVEARFILWHQQEVLVVPASSLFRYEHGWAVFIAQDGRAVRRPVTIGQRNGLYAQILGGVEEGEQVINHPSDDVDHDVPVEVTVIDQ